MYRRGMSRLLFALLLLAGCRSDADDLATDATLAADADPRCQACRPDQICIQFLGHSQDTCTEVDLRCEDRNPACTESTCSPDCDFWHCREQVDAGFYTCAGPGCAGGNPEALHCYGP